MQKKSLCKKTRPKNVVNWITLRSTMTLLFCWIKQQFESFRRPFFRLSRELVFFRTRTIMHRWWNLADRFIFNQLTLYLINGLWIMQTCRKCRWIKIRNLNLITSTLFDRKRACFPKRHGLCTTGTPVAGNGRPLLYQPAAFPQHVHTTRNYSHHNTQAGAPVWPLHRILMNDVRAPPYVI